MWKKDEPTPATQPRSESSSRAESRRSTGEASSSERAIIGPSIKINGEVSGDEDLLIQGQVDGSVELELHAVTIGRDGRVKANITARVVTVEGNVEGDLIAQEQIILRGSARVVGDITAPRVVLEDGASFKGLVDMGERPEAKSASNSKATGGSSRASDSDSGKTNSESSTSSVLSSTSKGTDGSEVSGQGGSLASWTGCIGSGAPPRRTPSPANRTNGHLRPWSGLRPESRRSSRVWTRIARTPSWTSARPPKAI